MSKVCTPYGFCQALACGITATDVAVKFKDVSAYASLCAQLGEDCYTHMVLSDCVRHEIVKVTCSCGELVIERGQEDTTPLPFATSTEMSFVATPTLMIDAVRCKMLEEGEELEIKSDTLDISRDDDDRLCIELKKTDSEKVFTWCSGTHQYTWKDGVMTQEPLDNKLTPGKYTNATVLIGDDCKIESVVKGSPVIANSCGGCGTCSECCD